MRLCDLFRFARPSEADRIAPRGIVTKLEYLHSTRPYAYPCYSACQYLSQILPPATYSTSSLSAFLSTSATEAQTARVRLSPHQRSIDRLSFRPSDSSGSLTTVETEPSKLRLSLSPIQVESDTSAIMRRNSTSSLSSVSSRASSVEAEDTMQIFVKNVAGDSKQNRC